MDKQARARGPMPNAFKDIKNLTEQKAKKLCKELGHRVGLKVEGVNFKEGITVWVWPPSGVYAGSDLVNSQGLREKDPYEGRHYHDTRLDALYAIRVYQFDLCFHHLGIDSHTTRIISIHAQGVGECLLDDFIDGYPDRLSLAPGLILADWLMDQGGYTANYLGEYLRDKLIQYKNHTRSKVIEVKR
jgi:hypothetical protein